MVAAVVAPVAVFVILIATVLIVLVIVIKLRRKGKLGHLCSCLDNNLIVSLDYSAIIY